jgi:hypothetical protein
MFFFSFFFFFFLSKTRLSRRPQHYLNISMQMFSFSMILGFSFSQNTILINYKYVYNPMCYVIRV